MNKLEITTIIDKFVKQYLSTKLDTTTDNITLNTNNKQLITWWNNLDSDWKSIFKKHIKIQNKPTVQDLQKIINLKYINAEHFNLKSLEPLSQLTHLKKLIIRNTAVLNLDPLKNLKELEYLDATFTMINSLKPLWNLPKLVKIFCKRSGRLVPTEVNEFIKSHRHCQVDWDFTEDQNWQPGQTW